MKDTMQCPACGGQANLKQEDYPVEYQGKSYAVKEHGYRCIACELEFHTEEQVDLALGQIPGYMENALKSTAPPAPPQSS